MHPAMSYSRIELQISTPLHALTFTELAATPVHSIASGLLVRQDLAGWIGP